VEIRSYSKLQSVNAPSCPKMVCILTDTAQTYKDTLNKPVNGSKALSSASKAPVEQSKDGPGKTGYITL
jgi:hypothetical protein